MFSQVFAAFLRNDGNSVLATAATLGGGIFNLFGDFFFTFTLDMGIMGAGLATAIGNVLAVLIMLTHFLRKQNTLRLVTASGIFFSLCSSTKRPLAFLLQEDLLSAAR